MKKLLFSFRSQKKIIHKVLSILHTIKHDKRTIHTFKFLYRYRVVVLIFVPLFFLLIGFETHQYFKKVYAAGPPGYPNNCWNETCADGHREEHWCVSCTSSPKNCKVVNGCGESAGVRKCFSSNDCRKDDACVGNSGRGGCLKGTCDSNGECIYSCSDVADGVPATQACVSQTCNNLDGAFKPVEPSPNVNSQNGVAFNATTGYGFNSFSFYIHQGDLVNKSVDPGPIVCQFDTGLDLPEGNTSLAWDGKKCGTFTSDVVGATVKYPANSSQTPPVNSWVTDNVGRGRYRVSVSVENVNTGGFGGAPGHRGTCDYLVQCDQNDGSSKPAQSIQEIDNAGYDRVAQNVIPLGTGDCEKSDYSFVDNKGITRTMNKGTWIVPGSVTATCNLNGSNINNTGKITMQFRVHANGGWNSGRISAESTYWEAWHRDGGSEPYLCSSNGSRDGVCVGDASCTASKFGCSLSPNQQTNSTETTYTAVVDAKTYNFKLDPSQKYYLDVHGADASNTCRKDGSYNLVGSYGTVTVNTFDDPTWAKGSLNDTTATKIDVTSVTLKDTTTNVAYTLDHPSAGVYTSSSIPPGTYRVDVGFNGRFLTNFSPESVGSTFETFTVSAGGTYNKNYWTAPVPTCTLTPTTATCNVTGGVNNSCAATINYTTTGIPANFGVINRAPYPHTVSGQPETKIPFTITSGPNAAGTINDTLYYQGYGSTPAGATHTYWTVINSSQPSTSSTKFYARTSSQPFLCSATRIPELSNAISGNVFEDLNDNGIQDTGENTLIANIPVALSGPTPKPSVNSSATAPGYSFSGLATGTYTVTFGPLPAGYTATGTFGTTRTVDVSAAGVITITGPSGATFDYGVRPPYVVNGQVTVNKTGSCVADPLANGIQVNLNKVSGAPALPPTPKAVITFNQGGVDGKFDFSGPINLNAGGWTLSLGTLPAGYSVISATLNGVTTSYAPASGVSLTIPPATNTINICISSVAAWWQVGSGDVRMKSVADKVPAGPTFGASTGNPANAMFFSSSGTGVFDPGKAQLNGSSDWVVNQEYTAGPGDSKNLAGSLSFSKLNSPTSPLPKDTTTLAGCGASNSCALRTTQASVGGNLAAYYVKPAGNLSFTFADVTIGSTDKVIILVDGNVSLVPNAVGNGIHVAPGGILLIAASGNLIFGGGMGDNNYALTTTHAEGIFTAEGNIRTQAALGCAGGSPDRQLRIGGVVIANAKKPFDSSSSGGGIFENRRTLCVAGDAANPSTKITQRLDFIFNLPDVLKPKATVFHEVQP